MPATQQLMAKPNPAGKADTGVARYCYYCRHKHPPTHPMRRIDTPCGIRWRCRASIEAARQDAASREAWGRAKTQANKSQDRRAAEYLNQLLRQGNLP